MSPYRLASAPLFATLPEAERHPGVAAENAVEVLSDDELEAELTVVSHDPVRRARRYDELVAELLRRRRGYRRQVAPVQSA